tara:strand:+ start:89 stop:643 length:555 start_codon:yes stop_codon:yes gene_type:complete
MENNDLVETAKILGITTENYKLEPDNDYLLFQFLGGVMDMVEFKDKGCITPDGKKILLYSGFTDALKEGSNQQELTKCCLWLFIGYTLSILFIGFLEVKDEKLMECVPKHFEDTMELAKEKIMKKLPHYIKTLTHLTSCLDEEHLGIFNNEKRRQFSRDLFDAQTLHMGSKIPEDVKKSAVEVK